MTVQAVPPSSRHTASAGATDFVYAFKIRRGSDLLVRINDVTMTLGVHYSVAGVTAPTGTVTFFTPLTGGELVQLDRAMPYDRTTDYQNLGDLRAFTLNNDQDDPVMMIQQIVWQQEFVARFPDALVPGSFDPVLPLPALQNVIGWNDTLTGLKNYAPADLATSIAYGDTTVVTFPGNGVQAAFILPRDPTSLGNLDVSIDGVTQVNGVDFTYAGTTLNFLSPPPNGSLILVRFAQALPVGFGFATTTTFQQAGIGAVARSVEARLRETIHLKDMGDVSTAAAATATLKRAIVLAQTVGSPKTIRLPYGTMGITEPIVVTGPVRIEGEGGGYYAWQGHADDNVTNLIWAGGITSEPMFKFQNNNFGGAGLSRVLVNCNGGPGNLCNGVYYENSVGTLNEQLGVFGFDEYGVKLNGVGSTCSWNSFINLNVESSSNGKCCLWLAGSPLSNGNACHNTFTNTRVVHGGNRHGVVLGGCDNNLLDMLFVYRAPGGTGRGVICDFTESSPFPNGNTFSHAQLGDGGYFEPAAGRSSSSRPAAVFWPYQTDNGQPFPVHTDGARTPMIDDTGAMQGINSIGKHTYMGANWKFNAIYGPADGTVIAVAFPNGAVSSVDYNIVANIGDLKTWCINAKTVNGFNLVINSAFAGPTYCEFLVLGG